MRLLKSNPILRIFNSYLVDSPQPANISYLWNFGSLLGTCLVIQILTGIFLAMHYQPNVELAFDSIEHIMRDVNNGYLIRYTHANVASFFFIFVYAHIARGLYYGSYKSPRVAPWSIGVVIFVLMMGTAFLGYKLNSPKWFKLNNNNNNNNIYNNKTFSLLNTNNKWNFFNVLTTKRYYSNLSNNYNTNYRSKIFTDFLEEKKLNPIFIYDNLQDTEVRKEIQIQTEGLSGVYLILNKITLDYYVGSASTNKIYVRFSNHLMYFRGSKIVKLAVKKYDITNFAFMVLELFPEVVNKENNKKLLDMEDFYLKSLLPNYNILTEAGSSFGYKHTEITRIKMKSYYSLERRITIGNLNKNNLFSKETIEKMRDKALNRNKRIFSDKALLNMTKKSKPIRLYNLDYTVYAEYSSIVEAAKQLNCHEKTIIRALKTEKKLLKRRWIIKYIN